MSPGVLVSDRGIVLLIRVTELNSRSEEKLRLAPVMYKSKKTSKGIFKRNKNKEIYGGNVER